MNLKEIDGNLDFAKDKEIQLSKVEAEFSPYLKKKSTQYNVVFDS